MATKPKAVNLTATTQDILNTVRSNSSAEYQNLVPKADGTLQNLRSIGTILMDTPMLKNEFLSALFNRIGKVIIVSKMYDNPWAFFKKGMLEYGETIEEIFVNIAEPHVFDQQKSESEVFKREIPDVKSAFHVLNYQTFYKQTTSDYQLKQAFLTYEGITDLIYRIIDAMTTSSNYDEFLVMKYLLARRILDGDLKSVQIPTVQTSNLREIVGDIKGVSNDMEFLNRGYNSAGVYTHSVKDEQYLLVNTKFDATIDVEVLASAFNMDKASFMGHKVLVDSFGKLDKARLAKIFEKDETYTEISDEDLKKLDAIPCVLVSREWFMIFDVLQEFNEQYNGEGLYWNHWLHSWKVVSSSPFAQNALFVAGEIKVDSVTVSPSIAALNGVGSSIQLTADIVTENFAPKGVLWTSDSDKVEVTESGKVTVLADAESGEAHVTATSAYDDTKTGTCTITVTV